MRTGDEIATELRHLKHALTLRHRWNPKAQDQIEKTIEVLERRQTPEEVELLYYTDETADEYEDGDNDLWTELDSAARWLHGEDGFSAPSEGLE